MISNKKPWGAVLMELALRRKKPIPKEPVEYFGLPEILLALREITGLTQVDMAAKFGISVSTLAHAEAKGGQLSLQAPTLYGVRSLAEQCCLPEAVRILGIMIKRQQSRPQRGPKKRTGPWYAD